MTTLSVRALYSADVGDQAHEEDPEMPLIRYRVNWKNWPGAPGISTHYFSTSVSDFSAVRTFYSAFATLMPSGLSFEFPSTYDVINESNGQLSSTVATTPPSSVNCSGGASGYAGSAGAVARWNTSAVINGNKVVGRTYFVPLYQTQYDASGTLSSSCQTAIQNAGNALIAAYGDGLKVFARPFAGRTNVPGKPDIPARSGSFATALSCTCPDTAVVLRSRRQ